MKTTVYSNPKMKSSIRKNCMATLVLAVLVMGLAARTQAAVLSYYVILNGATEGTPSLGTGTAQVDYNDTAHTLFIGLQFSGLSANTTASHIHAPTASPFTGT